MKHLKAFWAWVCRLKWTDKGMILLGVSLFTLILSFVLASSDWSSRSGFMRNLGWAEVEIGDFEIRLKNCIAFSLIVGAAGTTLLIAGRRNGR